MNTRYLMLPLVACALISSCVSDMRPSEPPLQVVPFVDLKRYAGVWFEIASYPHSFQKGCVASRATYTLLEGGKVAVLNECRKGSLEGDLSSVTGTASVADPQTNAKLKVTFFWPFSGDYWIIDLGQEYEYAVVGHPSRNYLWILSRTPQMDEALYQRILQRLREQSYDTSRLLRTLQAK